MTPSDKEIERLLRELRSEQPNQRKLAADGLAALSVKSGKVVHALETVAAQDSNEYVRQAALRALERGASPKRTPSRREKMIDFAIGFVGWFLVNGILYILVNSLAPRSESDAALAVVICGLPLLLLLNVVVLIILAFKRKMMALGILAAYGVNLAITVILGMSILGVCGMVPYLSYGRSGILWNY